MDYEELWRENSYRHLSDEWKVMVVKLLHAYILWRRLSSDTDIKWDVLTVFMGIIDSLRM